MGSAATFWLTVEDPAPLVGFGPGVETPMVRSSAVILSELSSCSSIPVMRTSLPDSPVRGSVSETMSIGSRRQKTNDTVKE